MVLGLTLDVSDYYFVIISLYVMTIFETIVKTIQWLFGFCRTTVAQVKPVVFLDHSNKIYEIDKYLEYKQYRYEIQLIRENLEEKKRNQDREIMVC